MEKPQKFNKNDILFQNYGVNDIIFGMNGISLGLVEG
jgi:hypothetical protein